MAMVVPARRKTFMQWCSRSSRTVTILRPIMSHEPWHRVKQVPSFCFECTGFVEEHRKRAPGRGDQKVRRDRNDGYRRRLRSFLRRLDDHIVNAVVSVGRGVAIDEGDGCIVLRGLKLRGEFLPRRR